MSDNDADDIRNAAQFIINSAQQNSMPSSTQRGNGGSAAGIHGQLYYPHFDISRGHSINLITEEFLGGYMQDGRMSVVRRFFCLFVTFDLFFVSLLWLICIMINGDNIFQAFQKQIVHYSIYTSLFDVVGTAIIRFVVLIIFYALLYIEHWFIIAFSTSGSCLFLISKVFVFDWVDSRQQVFEVILIITSFVIAWGEAWFLDCRVLPQERHARRYFSTLTSSDRSPLIAPFLATQNEHPQRESASNFYSPLDSAHDSEAEEEEDEEYHKMALECVRKAYALLETSDWKVEKVTSKGDTIRSTQREKIGKVYRLTARIKYPAKPLLDELFYRVEFIPKWNPTLLESKIVRKINSYTDITYQATVGGGGGIVKSRDFVNLRCWRLFRNGKMCTTEEELEPSDSDDDRSCEGSVSTLSDDGESSTTPLPSSVGSMQTKFSVSSSKQTGYSFVDGGADSSNAISSNYETLSRSLGAKGFSDTIPHFNSEPPPLDEDRFEDAKDNLEEDGATKPAAVPAVTYAPLSAPIVVPILKTTKDKVWVNAAISIDYAKVPPTKYTRGENIVAGFALREIEGKSDSCIFEWILCLDLKGYIPRYVLDTAYTTFMTDYMTHLRKYVNEMRQTRRRVPKN